MSSKVVFLQHTDRTKQCDRDELISLLLFILLCSQRLGEGQDLKVLRNCSREKKTGFSQASSAWQPGLWCEAKVAIGTRNFV